MGKPFTIGVAGGSGSGKTHFIKLLSSHFKLEEICLVSMDHYYKPIDQQQKDKNGIVNFDLPEAIERRMFEKDIIKLQKGQQVNKLEYTFNNPMANQAMLTFKPAPIIVVEGLFVQYFQEINALLDLKIFIDAEDQIKLTRRMKRDKEERGYEREDVLYRYHQHAAPVFEQLIAPLQSKADFIVHNNSDFKAAVDVVATFLRKKISGIGY